MPIVSVIVPCYKKADFLPETLQSVLSQTFGDWECIIINDGSPDKTEEVAHSFCKKDSRFKYVFQQNAGVAIARNNGIAASTGKYILPLDADDVITPECLEDMVLCFEQNPEATIVTGKTEKFGAVSGSYNCPPYDYELIKWGNVIVNSSMFKRTDYDKTGGYNPNMVHGYEDWDFWLSLLQPESKVYCVQKTLLKYRICAGDGSRAKQNSFLDNWIASHRQIYLNHPEIYAQYVPDIIMLHNREKDLERVLNSKSYKLGEKIARVFRKIRYRE